MKTQIQNIPDEEYHLGIPSMPFNLSRGEVKMMIDNPPAYCHHFHPRLGGNKGGATAAMILGTAIHAELLGTENGIDLVDFESFRTKEAKEKKAKIEARGNIAMTSSQFAELTQTLKSVKDNLPDGVDSFFKVAKAEQCITWEDSITGLLLRCKPDAYSIDEQSKRIRVIDVKTTGKSIDDRSVQRHANDFGADIQQVHYSEGLKALYGMEYAIDWQFLYISTKEPFLSRLVEIPDDWIDAAAKLRRNAIDGWAECIKSDNWPAYPEITELQTPYHMQPDVEMDDLFSDES